MSMFAKFKGTLVNVVGSIEGAIASGSDEPRNPFTSSPQPQGPPLKFRYTRPHFLQLNTDDEIQVSADHVIRPIIVPRDISKLPWTSGYAECINAGKSLRNEDEAAMYKGLLRTVVSPHSVAVKVADMMPTVPSYPRQVPINVGRVHHREALSSDVVPGSCTLVSPGENSEINAVTDEVKNGERENGSHVTNNSDSDPEARSKHEVKLSETPLNPADLISPTTPIPINDFKLDEVSLSSNPTSPKKSAEESLPWVYFGIFDGHAGSGVSVAAANTLHKIIQEKLQSIADLLIEFGLKDQSRSDQNDSDHEDGHDVMDSAHINKCSNIDGSLVINQDRHLAEDNPALLFHPSTDKSVTVDKLIIGALEAAFWEMDREIATEKKLYRMPGGCTVLVSLFILGKLYVANAGDSRSVMYKSGKVVPMSFDFTPESERQRVKLLGMLKPELLGTDFTHLEFVRRPTRRDLGKKLLYRDAFMTGWAYKTVTIDDLRFPLVYGEGKRSRVLATIGVTRGFGDHELKAQNSSVDIKPFLSPQPEVIVFDLQNEENLSDSDVIIMGTDGLWDVTSNERACEVVQKALDHFPANDQQRFKYRYISAAQDLIMASRGKCKERGKGWKTSENRVATIDDISVFVIPLKPYQQEFKKWKEARTLVNSGP
ncbi:Protein phosphatase 1H [Halotydeus destructor]|nr:Protein phosphatase 1H [Halotydeus destructor]